VKLEEYYLNIHKLHLEKYDDANAVLQKIYASLSDKDI
jgi:hypothetical protein